MSHPRAVIGNDLLVRVRVPCAYELGCDLVATLGIGGATPFTQDPRAADGRKPHARVANTSIPAAEPKG